MSNKRKRGDETAIAETSQDKKCKTETKQDPEDENEDAEENHKSELQHTAMSEAISKLSKIDRLDLDYNLFYLGFDNQVQVLAVAKWPNPHDCCHADVCTQVGAEDMEEFELSCRCDLHVRVKHLPRPETCSKCQEATVSTGTFGWRFECDCAGEVDRMVDEVSDDDWKRHVGPELRACLEHAPKD